MLDSFLLIRDGCLALFIQRCVQSHRFWFWCVFLIDVQLVQQEHVVANFLTTPWDVMVSVWFLLPCVFCFSTRIYWRNARKLGIFVNWIRWYFPCLDTQCMVYLPTFTLYISSLKINIAPEIRPKPKRKRLSSNHHFNVGAIWNFGGVSTTSFIFSAVNLYRLA